MKCPHCFVDFFDVSEIVDLENDIGGSWELIKTLCPSCKKFIIHLAAWNISGKLPTLRDPLDDQTMPQRIKIVEQCFPYYEERDDHGLSLVYPKSSSRPCPSEVPEDIAQDFKEACLVLADSPKASAALSRRCLQNMLHSLGIKGRDLSAEIGKAMESLPHDLAEQIDAIRSIGNFAAHPIKSTNTGEITDVEVGEAEWNLDILEELFDWYYVRPARINKKKDALDQKLQESGKKPMKQP